MRKRRLILLAATLVSVAVAAASAEEICTFPTPADIDPDKELLITDLSVVNDTRATGAGAWSFGGLMAELAPDGVAPLLVKNWLTTFDQRQVVNGFPLRARPAVRDRLIKPWMRQDGSSEVSKWTPNLGEAPFRLLAIVYRPDLGVIDGNGAIRGAGEVRFVFTVLVPGGRSRDARPLPFTIIFEYELAASDREGVRAWATRWHALGRLSFGADYNAALQSLTDDVTRHGAPTASLRQIRTNEGLSLPWQLREFRVQAGRLIAAPLKDTPHVSAVRQARRLADAVNLRPDDNLPLELLGGSVEVPDRHFRWPRMQFANNVLRHNFALRTCNGCHSAETGIKADDTASEAAQHRGFRHISGRLHNERARLSEFITGNPALVIDPTGKVHTFCDLKIRQQALQEALRPDTPTHRPHDATDELSVARKRRERSD